MCVAALATDRSAVSIVCVWMRFRWGVKWTRDVAPRLNRRPSVWHCRHTHGWVGVTRFGAGSRKIFFEKRGKRKEEDFCCATVEWKRFYQFSLVWSFFATRVKNASFHIQMFHGRTLLLAALSAFTCSPPAVWCNFAVGNAIIVLSDLERGKGWNNFHIGWKATTTKAFLSGLNERMLRRHCRRVQPSLRLISRFFFPPISDWRAAFKNTNTSCKSFLVGVLLLRSSWLYALEHTRREWERKRGERDNI